MGQLGEDVVDCKLVSVNGRTYRVQCGLAPTAEGGRDARRRQPIYRDVDDEAPAVYGDADAHCSEQQCVISAPAEAQGSSSNQGAPRDVDEDDPLIKQEGGDASFVTRVSCDAALFPFLIGREGAKKKALERDTGASITFPRRDAAQQQANDVTVRGPTRRAVASAKAQLQLAMGAALAGSGAGRKLDYTHFVGLPLASPALAQQYGQFMRGVLGDPAAASRGIDESIFTSPEVLHLTLIMLKLYSEEQQYKAKQVLADLAGPVSLLLQGQPLNVQLAGLACMDDNPAEAHVMYLKVRDAGPGGRLEQLCQMVVRAFAQAGLLLPQDERPVKLHATVLNTRYRRPQREQRQGPAKGQQPPEAQQQQGQQGQQQGQQGQQRRVPFDGRPLLEAHGSLDMGLHALPVLHLSQRGKYDRGTGYYHCVSSLALA